MPGCKRIDRLTKFGNPYKMEKSTPEERDRVIGLFREYANKKVQDQPGFFNELKGYDLACWCAPRPCHGDVIIEILKEQGKI